jgi:predicted ATP-dependent endonuclease of OLD family
MVEGSTERILMPEFIDKLKISNLSSQFISTVEIGGAYAHHFYKFLDFLELRTLIITDLDSTKQEKTDAGIRHKACIVSEGENTSNAGIKSWFKEEGINLAVIRSKTTKDKIQGSRRIAFQINEASNECCGRSFEDAFIIANKTLFGLNGKNGKDLELEAYSKAEEYKYNKSDFAIKYAYEKRNWEIPLYIKEGLIWLSENESDKVINVDLIK